MTLSRISTILCIAFASTAAARSLAESAIQHITPRDSPYQGGWPLGLSTSATDTCPANSVACATTNINPTCCPADNTCVWGASTYQFYCCPTDADCNEAVTNFPRCAFDNQTMFTNYPGGFFCCNPGELGVTPSSGKDGGLCESADQAIPTSLLATIVAQIGIATPTPTPGGPGNSNATATAGSGGSSTETNPSKAASSTSGSGNDPVNKTANAISKWPLAVKIGVGVGVGAAVVVLCIVSSLLRNRRRRIRGAIPGVYGYGTEEYDEYGNRINAFASTYVSRPGYEPYRNAASPANNVTVNVVHGDQIQ